MNLKTGCESWKKVNAADLLRKGVQETRATELKDLIPVVRKVRESQVIELKELGMLNTSDVFYGGGSGKNAGSRILNQLKLMKKLVREESQYRITVIGL